jgi:hypothetical protein
MKIKIKDVRLAYVNIFEPTNMRGEDDPKKKTYNLVAIFDPKHDANKQIEDAMLAAAQEKFPDTENTKDRGRKKLAQFKKKGNVPYFVEENTNDNGDPQPGFAGMHYLRARNKTRPTIKDLDATTITQDIGRPYSGCYAHVIVDIWAQGSEKGYEERINCSLLGVQFFRDGDSFGGSKPATDEDFEDLSDTGGEGGAEDDDDDLT